MNKSESIKELAAALAKAQGEIENANKNAANPHFRSKYADLAEVLNTVRPVFAKHGLSISQWPGFDGGLVTVETILMHSSGEYMSSTASTPIGAKNDAQGVGSALTYLRRYSLAAVAGIAQEDDDGNKAVQTASTTKTLSVDMMTKYMDAINEAADMDALKDAYAEAFSAAGDIGDKASQKAIIEAKDARKAILQEQQ